MNSFFFFSFFLFQKDVHTGPGVLESLGTIKSSVLMYLLFDS